MSRVASNPVKLPSGVEITLSGQALKVKGSKGSLDLAIASCVDVKHEDGTLVFDWEKKDRHAHAMAGTVRALVSNMVDGVSNGYERKLELQGVGYRAKVNGKVLNLTLGFSHPVNYPLPEGISAETPSPTQIILKGIDKQQIGQVAAEIRAYRPPEPYKGKGIRYEGEHVRRKEAKKK